MRTSSKPRLNVSLTPESRASLERFSATTGIAAAQLIRSIMHDAIPVVDAMTEAMAIAKSAPQQAADLMTEQLLSVASRAAQSKFDLDEAVQDRKLRRRPVKG